ncbi:MAG TPA: hypothetical protein VMM13_08930, partial [Euzebya sp.]|nr:hypothetical protein [Euzebya sp.]
RRKAYGWGGGLALAGAAAALVAVVVLPGDGPRVEFAPPNPDGGVATQPATAPEATAPTPDEEVPVPASAEPVAGGILYSDGDSIHVTDLDGEVLFTPSPGDEVYAVTDVAVRPGGTTADFTMAVRVQERILGVNGCGELFWNHVTLQDGRVDGGTLPEAGISPGGWDECLGAPVFASDGSALGWLTETADAEVQLQAVDWTAEGPVEGSLTTFSLDTALGQAGLSDPVLLDWTVEQTEDGSSDFPAVGVLMIRAMGESGLSTYVMTGERRSDGGFTTAPLVPSLGELIDESGIGGTIIDAHHRWRLVRLPTGDAEERVGLATPVRQQDGEEVPPLTVETELLLDVDARPFLDAMGDTAVLGVGEAMVLAKVGAGDADNPGSVEMNNNLPTATTAALLAQPGSVSPDRGAPAADPSPTSTPSPAATSTSSPTVPPVSAPTPTDVPTDAAQEIPAAVRSTAAAILDAAQARDYGALATLIPGDGFTSNFGGTTDHIAFYQQEEANGIDVMGTLADLLTADPVRQPGTDLWVWPEAYLSEGYLGYRVGLTDAGTWQFYVAGD